MIAGQKWYISDCTSIINPVPYQDLDVLYLPVEVTFDEESQLYSYKEYRLSVPIDYELPKEAQNVLADTAEGLFVSIEEASKKVETAKEQVKQATSQAEEAEARAKEATEQAEQVQEMIFITRDFLPDVIALTMPQIYDEWDPNGIVYTGKDKATEEKSAAIVRRNGKLYRCLQSHTSQENWKPETSHSLWVEIADPALEWPEWKQPTGAHDAYDEGAKVSHNGKKWTSNVENNVWEPGVFGWDKMEEENDLSW